MNYAWIRADRLKLGMVAYRPIADATIIWIEQAGDLHLTLHYADNSGETVYRNAPTMIQVCHRRCYEISTHHRPIDPGKALLRVYRKRY